MGQLPGIANMRRSHLARIAVEVFNSLTSIPLHLTVIYIASLVASVQTRGYCGYLS